MRLIDADAFLVDQLRIARANETDWQMAYWTGVDDTLGDIADATTIDAVPVVRCKNCVFRSDLTGAAPFMYHYCRRGVGLSGEVKDDDFCSYGERKDGE